METIWVIATAILLFVINIFVFWKLTKGSMIKEYGKKLWNHWRTRLYYWQGAIYVSTAATILILFLLKLTNVLTF